MLEAATEQLATIAGQKPNVRRARKSIAQLQAARGDAGRRVGHAARRARMYEFLDRLHVDSDPADPRLPRPEPALVRRPRQLLDRHPRADHLPRDRLRLDRPGPRARRHDHDDGARPTRRPSRCSRRSACPSAEEGRPRRAERRRGGREPRRRRRKEEAAGEAEAEQAALEQLKEENPEAYAEPRERREERRGRRGRRRQATAEETTHRKRTRSRWPRPHRECASSARRKFKTRGYTRCRRCGRARAVLSQVRRSAGSACASSRTRATIPGHDQVAAGSEIACQ